MDAHNPPTRPEHSEAYWRTTKWIILALTALMFITIARAVAVVFRVVAWS